MLANDNNALSVPFGSVFQNTLSSSAAAAAADDLDPSRAHHHHHHHHHHCLLREDSLTMPVVTAVTMTMMVMRVIMCTALND